LLCKRSICAIVLDELHNAALLLNSTTGQINAELQGCQFENLVADLPGRGIWVDEERIIEERLHWAARVVVKGMQRYQEEALLPEGAAQLTNYMRQLLGYSFKEGWHNKWIRGVGATFRSTHRR
jgi:hypothetical protein